MANVTVCPGCGATQPATGWTMGRALNASPECWQCHGEVVGFELGHPSLVGRFHQLARGLRSPAHRTRG